MDGWMNRCSGCFSYSLGWLWLWEYIQKLLEESFLFTHICCYSIFIFFMLHNHFTLLPCSCCRCFISFSYIRNQCCWSFIHLLLFFLFFFVKVLQCCHFKSSCCLTLFCKWFGKWYWFIDDYGVAFIMLNTSTFHFVVSSLRLVNLQIVTQNLHLLYRVRCSV